MNPRIHVHSRSVHQIMNPPKCHCREKLQSSACTTARNSERSCPRCTNTRVPLCAKFKSTKDCYYLECAVHREYSKKRKITYSISYQALFITELFKNVLYSIYSNRARRRELDKKSTCNLWTKSSSYLKYHPQLFVSTRSKLFSVFETFASLYIDWWTVWKPCSFGHWPK